MRWLLCAVFLALPAVLTAAPDALDLGLQAMGQTRETFRLDSEALITRDGGPYRLPLFTQWFVHPLRIPFWERHLRDGLLNNSSKAHALFNNIGLAINEAPRRDLIPPTPAEKYRKLAEAPDALAQAIHAVDPKAKVPSAAQVPPRVQQMAAALLFASADALRWREMAFRRIAEQDLPTLYASMVSPVARRTTGNGNEEEDKFPSDYAAIYQQQDLLAQVDMPLLLSAADDLTGVFDDVIADLQKTPVTETFSYTCKTRYGEIRLAGGTDDRYDANSHRLLIIDTGGNDTYLAGGASGGVQYPIGILIDAAGNDTYDAQSDGPSFGTGVLGWGLLADLAGNDHYAAKGFYSQGCGLVGVGVLYDAAGNDTYNALGGAQGMANFGLGILCDLAGDDTYDTYCYSQACGLTLAFGLLLDMAGNDRYTANDTDIIFPSAQSPKEHNNSMCQGAGSGMRRDYLDDHSLSGGIGMLLDAKGDDKYFGGVFTQAVGYWYGIGILDDRTGNDSYRGVWYAQSATAHFGISYQDDGAGDDLYTVTNCVSNGSAHDYSVSLFVEEGGNDTYDMRGSALGQGLNCGLGLFVDMAGNDHYKAAYSTAYGQSINFSATGLRSEIATYGLFLDLQGNDTYPGEPMGNAKTWLQKTEKPIPVYYGAGLDLEAGTVRWDGG
ncbi:MAG TPA: hypothetical protein VGM23_09605, partial [Armatimonadota bacterium]|jgi:hypothetical protein